MLIRERHGLSPRTRPISIVAGPSALGLTCGCIIGAIGFDPKSNFGLRELLVNIQSEQTGKIHSCRAWFWPANGRSRNKGSAEDGNARCNAKRGRPTPGNPRF